MFEVSDLVVLKLLPADKNEIINMHYCYFCYFLKNIFFKKNKQIMKSNQNPSGLIFKTQKQMAKRQSQSQVTSSLGHASG